MLDDASYLALHDSENIPGKRLILKSDSLSVILKKPLLEGRPGSYNHHSGCERYWSFILAFPIFRRCYPYGDGDGDVFHLCALSKGDTSAESLKEC